MTSGMHRRLFEGRHLVKWSKVINLLNVLITVIQRKVYYIFLDVAAVSSISKLLLAFQVRPLPIQPNEVEVLRRLNIDEAEMDLINGMVNRHTCAQQKENSRECWRGMWKWK